MPQLKKLITLSLLPQWSINQPPIGIAYLTSYLRNGGYEVLQRDFSIEMYSRLPKEKKYICESLHHENYLDHDRFFSTFAPDVMPYIDEWASELALCESPILGFTVLSSNRVPTQLLIERIKKLSPEKIIIIGGPHCTRYEGGYAMATFPGVDYVVPDEGEEVLLEMLDVLTSGGGQHEMSQVKGVLFLRHDEVNQPSRLVSTTVNKGIVTFKDERVTDTGERALINDINSLPIPMFDDFNLSLYDEISLPILGSRGCIYKCTFCSETVLWKRFRFRTGRSIFAEFKLQYFLTGVKSYYVVDSLINGSIPELENLCDRLIAAKLPLYWGGKVSIRKEMTRELLQKMRLAGCRNLDYGIESGSPKIIRDMKKGFKLPTASQVLKDSAEVGIDVGIFMMVGFPTESAEDYQLSKDFIRDHKPFLHHVTAGYGFGVQPGSETYIEQEKYGIRWKNGEWFSDEVTPEIVKFRVQDFRSYCQEIGVLVT